MDFMDTFRANMAKMCETDVFRPSTGPLLVRGNLSDGLPAHTDVFRKDRPSTQGSSGYRFGRLSQNSFFARHNPHPAKVRHIKGLLDVPICAVNDGGYFANPRYSLQFPPSNHDNKKLQSVANLPASAINVNNQMYPIDTISGLQYFNGKPLNFRVFREKAVPRIGMVPVSEGWRDELKALTEAVGVSGTNLPRIDDPRQKTGRPRTEAGRPQSEAGSRPRTSQYSANTGRLIPPPSRAMSRQASRTGTRRLPYAGLGRLDQLSEDPDMENMILGMLCQILQTDDVSAVQTWLVSAGDREKGLALEMIRSVLTNKEDYYNRSGAGLVDPDQQQRAKTADPGDEGYILGARTADLGRRVDRLSLDGDGPRANPLADDEEFEMVPEGDEVRALKELPKILEEDGANDIITSYKDDVFRPATKTDDRPRSRLKRAKTPTKPATPISLSSEAKLRYTMTEIKDQDICSQKKGLHDVLDGGEL